MSKYAFVPYDADPDHGQCPLCGEDGTARVDVEAYNAAVGADEYKEATDAAMNYGQGYAAAMLEVAEAEFISATRRLDRLLVERGRLEDLSAVKDFAASLHDRGKEGEETDGGEQGDPVLAAHDETPSEYQRFYDFVVRSDPAIVDAWHFTENNKPGGLAEQVRTRKLPPS